MEQSCAYPKLRNGFSVLVGIEAVNVMAAYRPVIQACGSHCEPHACTTGWYALIVCISWNNRSVFDTIDARCKHEDRKSTLAKLTKTESEWHFLFYFKIFCLIKRLQTTVIVIWMEPLNWENMKGSIYRDGGESKTPNNYDMCSPARNSNLDIPRIRRESLQLHYRLPFNMWRQTSFEQST
jgi:hypothetical protein